MNLKYSKLPRSGNAYCGQYCYDDIPLPKKRWYHGLQTKRVYGKCKITIRNEFNVTYRCDRCGSERTFWQDMDRTPTGVEQHYWEQRFDCPTVLEGVQFKPPLVIV